MDFTATERARRARLVLFDVDGVLTDGKIGTLLLGSTGKTFEPKGFDAGERNTRPNGSMKAGWRMLSL